MGLLSLGKWIIRHSGEYYGFASLISTFLFIVFIKSKESLTYIKATTGLHADEC